MKSAKKLSKKLKITFILYFFLFLGLSRVVYSQDFSLIDQDLTQLESLIQDTITNMQEQQKQLEDLKQNLNDSGALITSYETIITEQENLLAALREQLTEMSEIYRTQSALSAKYAQNYKFWRNFTLIAIPVTAIISGSLVWLMIN